MSLRSATAMEDIIGDDCSTRRRPPKTVVLAVVAVAIVALVVVVDVCHGGPCQARQRGRCWAGPQRFRRHPPTGLASTQGEVERLAANAACFVRIQPAGSRPLVATLSRSGRVRRRGRLGHAFSRIQGGLGSPAEAGPVLLPVGLLAADVQAPRLAAEAPPVRLSRDYWATMR